MTKNHHPGEQTMSYRTPFTLAALAALLIPAVAAADAPISYTGQVTDTCGVPVAGNVKLVLGFWSADTGGTLQCGADPDAPTFDPNDVSSESLTDGWFDLPVPTDCDPFFEAGDGMWARVTILDPDGIAVHLPLQAVQAVPQARAASSAIGALEARLAALEAASVPSGAVMGFALEECPDGWVRADGTGGTVNAWDRFMLDRRDRSVGTNGGWSTFRISGLRTGPIPPGTSSGTLTGVRLFFGGSKEDEVGSTSSYMQYNGDSGNPPDWYGSQHAEFYPRFVAVTVCQKQ